MVYSNVNKRADKKSASKNKNTINLDDEIIIGLATLPKDGEQEKEKKSKNSKKKQNGQAIQKLEINEKKAKKSKEKSKEEHSTKNIKQSPNSVKEKIKIQKRRIIRRISVILLLVVLLIGGIIYFFLSPIFNIKTIEVTQNNHVSQEQIINSSGIVLNENIFKFSKKEAQNNILSNPYIESVSIKRNIFLDKVQINVKERTATLMLEYGNSYVYINNQGYILEISTIKIDSPIIKGYVTPLEDVKPGNRLNKDDLERLDKVLSIIEEANSKGFGNLITHIDVKNKNNYVIVLESEDKTIYLGNCSDLSTQMLYIKEMIKREKGIEGEFFIDMDLNTSNPVFREKV